MTERDVDWQLVTRVQRGDKHAYELLVSKYQRRITRLLSRIIRDPSDIEDVAQEAFIKAYRALPSFRGESAFYTWLYRIAINTAKNHFAAQGRRAPTRSSSDLEDAENLEDGLAFRDDATPDALLLSKQVGEAVNRAIERLPEDLREMVPLAMWALHMGVLLYFLYDSSPNLKRTRKLVDSSVELTTGFLKMAKFPLLRPARRGVMRLLRDAELIQRT